MKLSIVENREPITGDKRGLIARIISAYSGIIRLYCFVRFKIIHIRFLEEIEQYLPNDGDILDLGCGFGLFALYIASRKPRAHVIGLDSNTKRLQIAKAAASKLGIDNVTFVQQDLREWQPTKTIAAAYALDVFHHVPVENGNRLLGDLNAHIKPGGRFLLKDIDTTPRTMLWFTFLLDLLMSPHDEFHYRSNESWQLQLAASGFAPIYLHYLWDILPYPHILLICVKPGVDEAKGRQSQFSEVQA